MSMKKILMVSAAAMAVSEAASDECRRPAQNARRKPSGKNRSKIKAARKQSRKRKSK